MRLKSNCKWPASFNALAAFCLSFARRSFAAVLSSVFSVCCLAALVADGCLVARTGTWPLSDASGIECDRRHSPGSRLEPNESEGFRPDARNRQYCRAAECADPPAFVEPAGKIGIDTLLNGQTLPRRPLWPIPGHDQANRAPEIP